MKITVNQRCPTFAKKILNPPDYLEKGGLHFYWRISIGQRLMSLLQKGSVFHCSNLVFLFSFFTILFSSCGEQNSRTSATEVSLPGKNGGGSLVEKTRVKTGLSRLGYFQNLINVNGKIRSVRDQLIVAETSGRIIKSAARNGTFISNGNGVIYLSTTDIEFKIANDELKRYNSLKEYESQLAGYDPLLKGKTSAEADTIKKKLRISTGLAATELNLKELKNELTRTIIHAPFSGVLTNVNVQAGEFVQAGQPLFRIYDPGSLYLGAEVLEENIGLLKRGLAATVTPLFIQDTFRATLSEIDPYVDENGMVKIKLRLDHKGRAVSHLFPGMNCNGVIEVPVSKSVLVPREAVVVRNGKEVVFTIQNDKAVWHFVKTGRKNDKEVEIKEGLKVGEIVITSNNFQLAHDAPVIVEK